MRKPEFYWFNIILILFSTHSYSMYMRTAADIEGEVGAVKLVSAPPPQLY